MNNRLATHRGRFEGVAEIAAFNWHWYLSGAAIISIATVVFTTWPAAGPIRVAGFIACGVAVFWAVASLGVSHWVYDRSPLRSWRWIAEMLPTAPESWCNIHCGLDESSASLRRMYPTLDATVVDIFDAREMTEPSIARARKRNRSAAAPADFRRLPLPDESNAAIFLLFAAHELRASHARETFFREVRRILHKDGRVIVVEHLRDFLNFCAFGPGAWHFFTRREWLRIFASASLALTAESRITPFVRVFVLRRAP